MAAISPNQIHKQALLCSSNDLFINKLVTDARRLHARGLPIIFTLRHLAYLAEAPFKYMHSVVSRQFCPYNIFTRRKTSGGRRTICHPHYPLRKMQDFIRQEILGTDYASNQIPACVFSFRKGRSIVDNAKQHIGAKWLIKTDICDFFASIHEPKVYQFFVSLGYNKLLPFELARLVTWPVEFSGASSAQDSTLLTSELSIKAASSTLSEPSTHQYKPYACSSYGVGALPQGASTSPQLSNIIFSRLDKEFMQLAIENGYTYTRYADDLIFSTFYEIDFKSARLLIRDVNNILASHGYRLNWNKTKISPPGTRKVVTGILIGDNQIHITKYVKDTIKMNIFYAEKTSLREQRSRIKFYGNTATFIKYLLGMINFAHQIDPDFASKWRGRLLALARKSGFFIIRY